MLRAYVVREPIEKRIFVGITYSWRVCPWIHVYMLLWVLSIYWIGKSSFRAGDRFKTQ